MPSHISLLRYTQRGIAAMKQGLARLDKAKEGLPSHRTVDGPAIRWQYGGTAVRSTAEPLPRGWMHS